MAEMEKEQSHKFLALINFFAKSPLQRGYFVVYWKWFISRHLAGDEQKIL